LLSLFQSLEKAFVPDKIAGNCILFRVEKFFTHPPKNFFCSEFERIALKLAAIFSFPALGRG
jgi:hypothetical protein